MSFPDLLDPVDVCIRSKVWPPELLALETVSDAIIFVAYMLRDPV